MLYWRERMREEMVDYETGTLFDSFCRKNMYSNRHRHDEQTPPLVRQVLPPSHSTRQGDENRDCEEHIELGSAYEIDHKNLPITTPAQLRSIRVMIVTEKTTTDVSVRFPSTESLQRYFSAKITVMYPEMDKRFVMGKKLADKVLCRKIPSQEFILMKSSADFWLVNGISDYEHGDTMATTLGTCLQELKGTGMLRWGVRRQVSFIGLRKENINPQSSSSIVKGEKSVKQENNEGEEEDDEENEEEEEEDDEAVTDATDETRSSRKRKASCRRTPVRLAKQAKFGNRKDMKPKNKCKQMILKNPHDRWSAERYKMAEKNLLEVMKAKGAVYGNPILRPVLRAEARKRIGDTGLLDHLLKQMAGKVAPGGKERFRRRHNAEGAMEYWLENADLVEIRREAGVQDTYWTPPAGWIPGDCPTQDPVCAKELKQLKEVCNKLQRQMVELVSRKHLEEEVSRFRREIRQLLSDNTMNTIRSCHEMGHNSSLVNHGAEKEEKQWRGGGEEEGQKCGGDEVKGGGETRADDERKAAEGVAREEDGVVVAEKNKRTEEKAEKIERMKSGFKICKPQGTFLWPNMGINLHKQQQLSLSQATLQGGDLFLIGGGPASVNSSSSATQQLLLQQPSYNKDLQTSQSPVCRPLAERRALSLTLNAYPTFSHSPRHENCGSNYSTVTTITTTTTQTQNPTPVNINLNDIPIDASTDWTEIVCGSKKTMKKMGGNWLALGTPNSV